jgi:predicted HAD superfamily phosphohydrolase YqeG
LHHKTVAREFFDYLIKKIGISNLSKMLIVGDSLMTDILVGNFNVHKLHAKKITDENSMSAIFLELT